MFQRTRDIKVSPIKQIEMAAARIPGSADNVLRAPPGK